MSKKTDKDEMIDRTLADAAGARGIRREKILAAGLGASGLGARSVRFQDRKRAAKADGGNAGKAKKRLYGEEY